MSDSIATTSMDKASGILAPKTAPTSEHVQKSGLSKSHALRGWHLIPALDACVASTKPGSLRDLAGHMIHQNIGGTQGLA